MGVMKRIAEAAQDPSQPIQLDMDGHALINAVYGVHWIKIVNGNVQLLSEEEIEIKNIKNNSKFGEILYA